MALEMIPTLVNMFGSEVSLGSAGHIIFSLSAKKGPMLIGLSEFLGMSGLGNGSHSSQYVQQRSFLRFCRACKW